MGQDDTLPADLSVAGKRWYVEDDLLDIAQVEGGCHTEQVPDAVEAHAGLEIAFEGVDDIRQVRHVEGAGLGLDRQEHLLLPGRPAEVPVDVVVPRPDVLERMTPVEVLSAGQDRDARVVIEEPTVDVVGIGIVEHRIADEKVNATEPVDQLDQAL